MAPADDNSGDADSVVYQIGEWRVYPDAGLLCKAVHRVHAEPKVMEVLVCLAKAEGKVVSREDLIARVWPRVVVNEEVLTRAVSELRTLLGDVSRERRYIVTIPKRGYRLIMPVRTGLDDAPEAPPVSDQHTRAVLGTSTARKLPAWMIGLVRYGRTSSLPGYLVVALLSYALWHQPEAPVPVELAGTAAGSAPRSQLMHELAAMKEVITPLHVVANQTDYHSRTLVVIPLSAVTDDAQTRAFAAGLNADLQHALAQQPNLQLVYASASAPSLSATGAATSDLVLSGSVRIYDQQARVHLQLVELHSSNLLWSGSFECDVVSPLAIQAYISSRVATELGQPSAVA